MQKVTNPIPDDLLIEIFSRVPSKSIGRFRCISKYWRSILGHQDFTNLFLKKFSTRPRLLFTFKVNGELFYYSSPQNLDGNNSSVFATSYNFEHKHVQVALDICTPVSGLVLCRRIGNINNLVICNPTTRETIILPRLDGILQQICFGYDPINKQFKVLCITWHDKERPFAHQVLTLEKTGSKLLFWRRVECKSQYHPLPANTSICINGVLYYPRKINGSFRIDCFDVRSEKFGFINIDVNMLQKSRWTLVNYNGKLAAHKYGNWNITFEIKELVLWVLEDAQNHNWSKHSYVVPCPCSKLEMKIVGMTCRGEIVFTPHYLSNSFDVFYYNLEKKTFTRVIIQGFGELKHHRYSFHTFVDYVENVEMFK